MYFRRKPYVPAAARRQTADRTVAKMQKGGQMLSPVAASRGAIAKSFWGKAWCRNLERYSDYSNRLPRGRTYLRNGSVIDLTIGPGEVTAQVMGSSLYRITVSISEVAGAHWKAIARDCARSIDTLVELLQGQLSIRSWNASHGREPAFSRHRRRFPSAAAARFRCDVQACRRDTVRNRRSARLGAGTSVRLAQGRRKRVDRTRRRGRDTGSQTARRRSNSGLVEDWPTFSASISVPQTQSHLINQSARKGSRWLLAGPSRQTVSASGRREGSRERLDDVVLLIASSGEAQPQIASHNRLCQRQPRCASFNVTTDLPRSRTNSLASLVIDRPIVLLYVCG